MCLFLNLVRVLLSLLQKMSTSSLFIPMAAAAVIIGPCYVGIPIRNVTPQERMRSVFANGLTLILVRYHSARYTNGETLLA